MPRAAAGALKMSLNYLRWYSFKIPNMYAPDALEDAIYII